MRGRNWTQVSLIIIVSYIVLVLLAGCNENRPVLETGRTIAFDKGGTMKAVPSPTAFLSIWMIDETTGWATTSQSILRTTDGGKRWVDITPLGATVFYALTYFLDASTGWVTDQGGLRRHACRFPGWSCAPAYPPYKWLSTWVAAD